MPNLSAEAAIIIFSPFYARSVCPDLLSSYNKDFNNTTTTTTTTDAIIARAFTTDCYHYCRLHSPRVEGGSRDAVFYLLLLPPPNFPHPLPHPTLQPQTWWK